MATLGIDFGTSNTGAGWVHDGKPEIIPLEGAAPTLPTAIFLDFAAQRPLYGRAAAQAMVEGLDGRFMRALKSVLGTPLARETRQLMGERLTLIDVIARFLAEIKTRAEAATGQRFDAALSGRPVRFHSADASRDAQALKDLTEAYHLAGFETVSFLPEPEAAALAVSGQGRLLIVDIGGGTSDFTVCERQGHDTRVLASHGLRLGGTDFDKQLSLAHVMPLLGLGGRIAKSFGDGLDTAPQKLFNDLASWERIPFVYSDKASREARLWERLGPDSALFRRLAVTLEMHLGHDIAYAVEAAKITANDASAARVDLAVVEAGLGTEIANGALMAALFGGAQAIAQAAQETVAQAGLEPRQIDQVVLVGGSSLLGVIQQCLRPAFPQATLATQAVFTAVVEGLAIASGRL